MPFIKNLLDEPLYPPGQNPDYYGRTAPIINKKIPFQNEARIKPGFVDNRNERQKTEDTWKLRQVLWKMALFGTMVVLGIALVKTLLTGQ